jgi:porin
MLKSIVVSIVFVSLYGSLTVAETTAAESPAQSNVATGTPPPPAEPVKAVVADEIANKTADAQAIVPETPTAAEAATPALVAEPPMTAKIAAPETPEVSATLTPAAAIEPATDQQPTASAPVLEPAPALEASHSEAREPANVVVPVPESTAPRSAIRDSAKEAPVAPAEPTDTEHLTGNWKGARAKLSDKGVNLGLVYKNEFGRNVGGGLKLGGYDLSNLDLRLSVDTEKLGLWAHGSFFFYGLFNNGADPTTFVGDNQYTSNIQTPNFVSRLYEAWYQHSFSDGKATLLIGLHDLNSEFYTSDSSSIFFNSSFGVGRELSQTGPNGPSIFPAVSPAIRFRSEPSANFYMQTAVFNGVSGDLNYPFGTHARVSPDDGMLIISEAAFIRTSTPKEGETSAPVLGKLAFGTWSYTHEKTSGSYLIIDQALSDKVSVLGRAGVISTDSTSYSVSSNISGGFVFHGIIPNRADDTLGIAATVISSSDAFKADPANVEAVGRESTLEVTYRALLCRGVVLQPDYQYIDHPFFAKDIPWAQTVGARLEINF